MQHYLLNATSIGAYSAAALDTASGFDVDFEATAGQQVSISAQLAGYYGPSPLSLTVQGQSGSLIPTSQPYAFSYGLDSSTAADFIATTTGLYTATIQDSGQYTAAQNVDVSVTESGSPAVYLDDLHPEQSSPATVAWADTTSHINGTAVGQSYTGPVNYLQWQYLWADPDSVNISTTMPDVFLRGGPGNDALAANTGSNVLDGGTGSNFLVGASGSDGGADTFFVDGRGGAATWSTITNFHPGDAVTLWGFIPGQSAMSWAASDGAAGYQGATIHAETAGAGTPINASVTFAGVSLADAQSKFAITAGTAGGVSYLYAKYVG